MLHGLETLKAKGMTRAMLGVDDQNPSRANRLYEKVGFRVKKKGAVPRKAAVGATCSHAFNREGRCDGTPWPNSRNARPTGPNPHIAWSSTGDHTILRNV
jgi:hypothetical protein